MAKNYSNTYLYNKYPYEEKLFKFIMTGQQISVVDPKFDDIKFEFKKRQVHPALIKVLSSKNVVLLISNDGNPLSKQFKVFCSKDVKSKTQDYKVFVDCTGLIYIDQKTGNYATRMIDILIAYMVNAMTALIYHKQEKLILTYSIIQDGMLAFSSLFTHVVDYLTKISAIASTKTKCQYLACMYFVENILGKEFDSNFKNIAGKICQMSEREQEMIITQVDDDDFINLKIFIEKLSEELKVPGLKIDNVVDKWMYLFGPSTVFALEYFPALSAMLTDAYVGCYINNQKTIEKVVGNTLISFTKSVLDKGGSILS